MNRSQKIQYIQERLGSEATERDAEIVLEALEDAEVVIRGKIYSASDWEDEVSGIDFAAVLEDAEAGREVEIWMSDRYGRIRSFIGAPAAIEALAERLEREGYQIEYGEEVAQ